MYRLLQLILCWILLSATNKCIAQVYNENFDGGTVNMSGSGSPGFSLTNAYSMSTPNSYFGSFATGGESVATSTYFAATGNQYVTLEFSHICKTSFFDSAVVELSVDSGITWTQLNSATCSYLGASPNFSSTKWFGAFSYTMWDINNPGTMSNSWWKQELFDISNLCANQPAVSIRFRVKDNNNNGMENFYGWVIDDVVVNTSPCELQPPTVNIVQGPSGQVIQPVNTTVIAYLNDNSGSIASSELYYSVNGSPYLALGFTNVSDSLYAGNLPQVSIGDSVCWYIQVSDSCLNMVTTPVLCFEVNSLPCDLVPPSINVYMAPSVSSSPAADTIGALITDNFSTIVNPTLSYQVNGGTLTILNMTNISGTNYQAVIPAVNVGDEVCWYITASDTCFNTGNTLLNCFTALVPITLPYATNFDTLSPGWFGNSAGGSTWELGFPSYGLTTGTHSGSLAWDVELNSPYMENTECYLTSPVFDLTGDTNATVSFWQNYYSETPWDGVRMEYSTDGGNWNLLGGFNDPNGINWYNINLINSSGLPAWTSVSGGWKKSSYNLSAFNNVPSLQFRFVFTSDASVERDGHTIDDFEIRAPMDIDAGINSIYPPPVVASGTTTGSWLATIKNFGAQSINNVPVSVTLNGSIISTVSYPLSVLPGDSASIVLNGFVVPSGQSELCVFTTYAGDGYLVNDTLCSSITGIPVIVAPYSDNFDGGNVGWYSEVAGNPLTQWELGAPAFGSTNSAYSGTNAWDINLGTPYTINAQCYLYSPYFDYTVNVVSPYVSFWHNYDTENAFDGMRVEYSVSGNPWSVLGMVNDINATNWYTDSSLNSSFLPAWEDNSGGWIQSTYKLDFILPSNSLQFRFVFSSDGAVVGDGYSIDDFVLSGALAEDIGVSRVISPNALTGSPVFTPVEVRVKNFGYNPQNSFDVTYIANGGTPVTVSYNNLLQPLDSVNITLPGFTTQIGQNNLKVYTSLGNDLMHFNDTLNYTFFAVFTTTPPYADPFDAGNLGWIVDTSITGTQWELGLPAFGATSSVHSGTACWDVNLDAPYHNAATTRLVSPVFNYLNSISSSLKFWYNYNMEYGQDGMRVEFTTDGVNYNVLGTYNDPNGTNWYDHVMVAAFNNAAFSGTSSGWKQATFNTTAFSGISYIQYAFVFKSDVNLSGDGVSIDDFELTNVVSVDEVTSTPQVMLYPNPVRDELTLSMLPAHGSTFVNEHLTFTICNALGSEVFAATIDYENNKAFKKLNVSELKAGVYFININTGKEVLVQKFVKQ